MTCWLFKKSLWFVIPSVQGMTLISTWLRSCCCSCVSCTCAHSCILCNLPAPLSLVLTAGAVKLCRMCLWQRKCQVLLWGSSGTLRVMLKLQTMKRKRKPTPNIPECWSAGMWDAALRLGRDLQQQGWARKALRAVRLLSVCPRAHKQDTRTEFMEGQGTADQVLALKQMDDWKPLGGRKRSVFCEIFSIWFTQKRTSGTLKGDVWGNKSIWQVFQSRELRAEILLLIWFVSVIPRLLSSGCQLVSSWGRRGTLP